MTAITSPLATVPGLPWPRLPELSRLRHLTRVNRWTVLQEQQRTTAGLHAETGGDLSRSPAWQGVFRQLGVIDVATTVFADRFGCWGWLDLWRSQPHPPFSPEELELLASIEPVSPLRCGTPSPSPFGSTRRRRPGPAAPC